MVRSGKITNFPNLCTLVVKTMQGDLHRAQGNHVLVILWLMISGMWAVCKTSIFFRFCPKHHNHCNIFAFLVIITILGCLLSMIITTIFIFVFSSNFFHIFFLFVIFRKILLCKSNITLLSYFEVFWKFTTVSFAMLL